MKSLNFNHAALKPNQVIKIKQSTLKMQYRNSLYTCYVPLGMPRKNITPDATGVIMSATRTKRTKIGDFSAQGWNLPKMHMPTSRS